MSIFLQISPILGDDIFTTVDWISMPKYSGYAFGYGLETIIGPIEIKQSWSPEMSKALHGSVLDFCFRVLNLE